MIILSSVVKDADALSGYLAVAMQSALAVVMYMRFKCAVNLRYIEELMMSSIKTKLAITSLTYFYALIAYFEDNIAIWNWSNDDG